MREACQHDLASLGVALLQFEMADAEVGQFERRRAAPESEFQPAAAHLVEHADFFDQPQRLVQRQHVHHRAKPQPRCALCDSRQHDARRRRKPERRRVVLGEMISVEAARIVGLDDAKSVGIELAERESAAIKMVEDAEFDPHLACLPDIARTKSQRQT